MKMFNKISSERTGQIMGAIFSLALFGCAGNPHTEATVMDSPMVRGESIKTGRLEIALCTDDSCGEKEISAFFQNEKPYVSSDLGEEKDLIVPVDLDFYESLWQRIEKLKFEPMLSTRSTAQAEEREGVPGCKASFHVRVQQPTQGWYTNICRNRDEAATALSYVVRDVDFMVLKHRSSGSNIK